jgi:hypothetical protein
MEGYDDGRVACDDQGIVIRHYYLFGAKRIGYGDIREARVSPLGWMGKWRIHGSGDLRHWFNFDPRRPRKDVAIVLYLDGTIRPVITPDDPERVTAELVAHGVTVTRGPESGLR